MRASYWLLFLVITQAMIGLIAPYFLPTSPISGVNLNESELKKIEESSATVTADNQFAILNLDSFNRMSDLRRILVGAVLPTGTLIDTLFPGVLPTGFIYLLNIIWSVLLLISAISFLRGVKW